MGLFACAQKRRPILLVLGLVAGLTGCNKPDPLGDVVGVVRLDGQPLTHVLIQFLPEPDRRTTGPQSRAASDPQGHYRLRCDDQRDGAVTGWHRVILEDMAIYDAPRREELPAKVGPPVRVPSVYRSANTTPLRFEVKPGLQTIDLELRRQP